MDMFCLKQQIPLSWLLRNTHRLHFLEINIAPAMLVPDLAPARSVREAIQEVKWSRYVSFFHE